MAKDQFNVRISAATRAKLDYLKPRYDSYAQIVAIAIDRLYQEEKRKDQEREWQMHNRVSQINWLRELAGNIAANLGEGTAEELVEYALSDEVRDDWGIEIPEWFDDHDRASLVRFVAESL